MVNWDVKATGFNELSEKLLSLADGAESDRIQAKALREAGNIIKDALLAVTPIRTTAVYGEATPEGALKDAVQLHIKVPKDGEAASARVDFGKLTYIAHIVDIGHMDAGNGGKTHTPAHPFIRSVEDASLSAAQDAYLTSLQTQLTEAISK